MLKLETTKKVGVPIFLSILSLVNLGWKECRLKTKLDGGGFQAISMAGVT